MEEEFDNIPDQLVCCQVEDNPTDILTSEFDLGYGGSSWDQLSEEGTVVSSLPDTPRNSDVSTVPEQQIPVQFPANTVAGQSYVSQAVQPSSPAIKNEVKSEPPESPVYEEPSVKCEQMDEVPQQTLIFPDANNSSNFLQTLAKGRSEDIDIYRNMLKCHGALTPDMEKKLRHLSRLVKNRESAQISRKRKREYVELLRNAIVKMRGTETSLRTVLNASQAESAQRKAEAERWQTYAHDLQKLLQAHGIEAPAEPAAAVVPTTVIPSFPEPVVDDVLPEALFDGPCGFGHMAPPKGCTTTTTTSSSRKKRGPRSEKRQKH